MAWDVRTASFTVKSHSSALGFLLTLSVTGSALANMILMDNFNDGVIDPSKWVEVTSGVGPTVTESDGRLEMYFPAASNNGADGGFSAEYWSAQRYTGDFDIRVGFDTMNWPAGNGVRIGLTIASWFVTARVSDVWGNDGQEAYVLGHSGGLSVLGTTDPSGNLRMVRENGILTGYFWNDGWSQIGTGSGPVGAVYFGVSAWSDDRFFGDKVVTTSFDDFVGYDQPSPGIGSPVPDCGSTGSLMLAAMVCLLGLNHIRRRAVV